MKMRFLQIDDALTLKSSLLDHQSNSESYGVPTSQTGFPMSIADGKVTVGQQMGAGIGKRLEDLATEESAS